MVIYTNRLVLRPFKVEDANIFYEITQDKAIKDFVPYASPDSLEEAVKDINIYYSKGDFIHDFYFIIELKSSKEIVGALIVTQNSDGEFDMSLIISQSHRQKGYMKEAVYAFIQNMPSNSKLVFIIEKNNQASLTLMSHLDVTEVPYEDHKHRKFLHVTH